MRDDVRCALVALTTSKNEHTAQHAKEILESKVSLLQAMDGFHGGFLKSVVSGDVLGAMHKADLYNQKALARGVKDYLTAMGGFGNAD